MALGACAFDGNGLDLDRRADGGFEDVDAPSEPVDAAAAVDASGTPDVPTNEPPDAAAPDAPASLPDAAVIPDAAPQPDAGACPLGYVAGTVQTGSCYRLVQTPRSWTQAEADCADDAVGAHLAVVSNLGEFQAFQNALGNDIWLGASDRKTEGTFLNVTGGPMLDNASLWAPNQPDEGGNGAAMPEDCVAIRDNGLNDDGCGDPHFYLCEIDGVPPDPNAF